MLQISRETLIGRIYCSSSIQLASSSVFEAWVLGFFSFLFSALNQSPLSNGHIVFQYSTYTYFANATLKAPYMSARQYYFGLGWRFRLFGLVQWSLVKCMEHPVPLRICNTHARIHWEMDRFHHFQFRRHLRRLWMLGTSVWPSRSRCKLSFRRDNDNMPSTCAA